jgi:hypothetical protein
MTPPIIEKKRVLLLAVCALATGAAPVACSADSPGTSSEPYDASGSVDSPYDMHPEGNVLIPYDAYVETDSDVDDAADADTPDANDDGG